MTNAAVKPFDYDDLAKKLDTKPAETTAPKSFTQADLDTVRQEGFDKGRTTSEAAAAETQAKALEAIGSALSQKQSEFETMIAAERDALKAVTNEFLTNFCEKFSAANDLALVSDLLDQLLTNSTDRTPAKLLVSSQTYDHAAKRIKTLIDARAAGFITLVREPSLAAGDCRIEWRTGSIARDLTHVRDAVAELINAERPQAFNPEQDT